jgi:dehydrogenase/reductase SDR family member 7B
VKNYKGKTIWITGAASGIGKALALEFASRGATIILSDRDLKNLDDVTVSCKSAGGVPVAAPFDLEKPEEIKSAVAKVLQEYPKIDMLFSNGGISQRSYAVDTPVEIDRKIMEVNFFGALVLTKELLPSLISGGGGKIAITSSAVGKFGFPLRTAYSASKHALQGYFEALRAELHDKNVKVTIVSPGRVYTNISVNAIDQKGNKYGRMDDGQAGGIPADKCARKIIRAVEKNRNELWVGGPVILMIYIRLYLPFLFYRLAPRIKPT